MEKYHVRNFFFSLSLVLPWRNPPSPDKARKNRASWIYNLSLDGKTLSKKSSQMAA
jgi:hypothetical protein